MKSSLHFLKKGRRAGKFHREISTTCRNQNTAEHKKGTQAGLPLFLQPRLVVNQPGDEYEHEADLTAEKIMRMPDPVLQRQDQDGEEEELLKSLINSESYDVIIHGHTHEAKTYQKGRTLVLNPGETCGYLSGKATIATLDTKTLEVKIIQL